MPSKHTFDPEHIHPEAQVDLAVLVMSFQGQGSTSPTFEHDFTDKLATLGFSQGYIADAILYAESVAHRYPIHH